MATLVGFLGHRLARHGADEASGALVWVILTSTPVVVVVWSGNQVRMTNPPLELTTALRTRPAAHTTAALAVSTVIFGMANTDLVVPLVRRLRPPHESTWALPGGWIESTETLQQAATRTLAETTGLRPRYLEQLYTLAQPDRQTDHLDTPHRVASVIYFALISEAERATVTDDPNIAWFPVAKLPKMAFDHDEVLQYALWRLRNKITYAQLAHHFLPVTFTMAQLRCVYETVLGERQDPANFRRTVEAHGTIYSTGERLQGGRHRPPLLYRAVEPTPDPSPTT